MPEDRRFLMHDRSHPVSASLIGISYCSGKYRIHRKKSPLTVVEYVTDGEGYVMQDGEYKLVGKDQIYICPAGMPHDYYSSYEKPWTKIWMNIYGKLPALILKEYGFSGVVIADGAPLKPLFEKARTLIYCEKSNKECRDEILSIFMLVADGLFHLKEQAALGGEAGNLKMFLDNNTHRIVSNAELAKEIHRSPDYCVKLFKRQFGTAPYDYQLKLKMEIARQMLRQTDMPVFEIAAALGYNDAQYFSGLFKRKCGISPNAYRKADGK